MYDPDRVDESVEKCVMMSRVKWGHFSSLYTEGETALIRGMPLGRSARVITSWTKLIVQAVCLISMKYYILSLFHHEQ